MRTAKLRRWSRLWAEAVWSESLPPLTPNSARLRFIAVATLVFLVLPKRGPGRVLNQAISTLDGLEALACAIAVFVVLKCFFAIWVSGDRNQQIDEWLGLHF
jgi:sorbitol-specific phosphotransferase system component IIBC